MVQGGNEFILSWQTGTTRVTDANGLISFWDDKINAYNAEKSMEEEIAKWKARVERFKKEGRDLPVKPTEPKPSPAVDRNNPGASYNGVIAPIASYAVKGALFYQGINNAVGGARPTLYAKTYASLIPEWRRVFHDKKLPFGICQMVSWGFPPEIENIELDMVSAAPHIREAQLNAHLAYPETGFVVAYDLGHIQMHSPFKTPLGERLARWALATQYNRQVTYRTPLYKSMKTEGHEVAVQFDVDIHPLHGGRANIQGFTVAGEDRHFYPAEARLDRSDTVRLSSKFVPDPVAVRYAWSTHPFGMLVGAGSSGLPAAPFRTDAWEWKDAPFAKRGSLEDIMHRRWQTEQRDQAADWAKKRLLQEANVVLKQTE